MSHPKLPGVRCNSWTFNLNLPSTMYPRLHLSQVHHRPIPQLPGEQAELVSAVTVRSRLGARDQPGAAEILRTEGITPHILFTQPDQSQRCRGQGYKSRTNQGLESADPGVTSRSNRAGPGLLWLIHWQLLQRAVIEAQALKSCRPASRGIHESQVWAAGPVSVCWVPRAPDRKSVV